MATEENAIPVAFETRNAGVTLEVEPKVGPGGNSILLNLIPQRVVLVGYVPYYAKTHDGKIVKVEQPEFFTSKTTATIVLRNGQRSLLAVQPLPQPENTIEFFIVQAVATPAK